MQSAAAEDTQENPVRDLSTITDMIMNSGLPDMVKERSIQVFTELGEAEAKTHGSTLAQVEASRLLFTRDEVARVWVSCTL